MKNSFIKIICILLSAAVIVTGAFLIREISAAGAKPFPTATNPAEDAAGHDVLFIDELSVVAPYVSTGDGDSKTLHCLVSFTDSSNDMCIASLSVPSGDELYSFIEAYLADDSVSVGEYAVNGYFTAMSLSESGKSLYGCYRNSCEQYDELLKSGSRIYNNGNVTYTDISLVYSAPAGTDYAGTVNPNAPAMRAVGVLLIVVGSLCFALSVFAAFVDRRKKT